MYRGERCADLFAGVTVMKGEARQALELTAANTGHSYAPFDWGGGACRGARALATALVRDALAMRDVPLWLETAIMRQLVLKLKRPEFVLGEQQIVNAVADALLQDETGIDLSEEPWKHE